MTPVLCFALFVVLGAAASFQDWTEKKIRNRLILFGLGACAAVLAGLFLSSALGHFHRRVWLFGEFYLPWRYYPKVALHFALSLAAALALWRLSIWPAGDAKLFALFSLLAVLVEPNLPGFPAFLFLLLLINIFVPAGLVFAVESVVKALLKLPELAKIDWKLWPKAKLEVLAIRFREFWPHRAEYLVLGVNLFFLFFAVQAAQRRFLNGVPEPLRSLAVFFFMFVFWQGLVSVLRRKTVGLIAFLVLSAWLTVGGLFWRWDLSARLGEAVGMTLNFGVFLSGSYFVFNWFIERESLRELRPEHLKLGTVLSDRTWERLAEEQELAGKLSERRVDGLTHGDAEALKAWLAGRTAADYTVYQTIPFALWIFLGTLLTLSGRANVVALMAPAARRAGLWLHAARLGWPA